MKRGPALRSRTRGPRPGAWKPGRPAAWRGGCRDEGLRAVQWHGLELHCRSGRDGFDYETDTGISSWYDRGDGGQERMWFDGSDDKVDLASDASLHRGSSTLLITMTFATVYAGSDTICLFDNRATDGSNITGLFLGLDSSGELGGKVYNGSGSTGTSFALGTGDLRDGIAHDMSLLIDNDGNLTIEVDSVSDVIDIGASYVTDTAEDYAIGSKNGAVSTSLEQWLGVIHSFQLSVGGEVKADLRGTKNADSGWTDQSGNGNDGTVAGTPARAVPVGATFRQARDVVQAVGDNQPAVGTDRCGRNCPEGDGSNDYLQVAFGQTFAQPVLLAVVARYDFLPEDTPDYAVDGDDADNRIALRPIHASDEWGIDSGGTGQQGSVKAVAGRWDIVIADVNGASSRLWVNGVLVMTGQNPGPDDIDGLTVLNSYLGNAAMDGALAEVAVSHDPSSMARAAAALGLYLNTRHRKIY